MENYFSRISRLLHEMGKRNRFIVWFILSILLGWIFFISVFALDKWYVISYYLNVRSEGRYGAPIITAITRGTEITILASLKNGWKKIELSDGTIGYVNGRYLSAQEPVIHVSMGQIYKVSVGNAFMRGDTLQTKIAVVKKGDSLEVISDGLYKGKWLRVKIISSSTKKYDDRIGYISKELVKTIRPIVSVDPTGQIVNDDWIEDFNVINVISTTGSGSGVGTLAPLTSSIQADMAISGIPSTAAVAPIVSSGVINSGSGNAVSDEINGIVSDILR